MIEDGEFCQSNFLFHFLFSPLCLTMNISKALKRHIYCIPVKSSVLPWVRNSYLTQGQGLVVHKIGCIGCHVTLSLSDITTMSVFFKMVGVKTEYFKVTMN